MTFFSTNTQWGDHPLFILQNRYIIKGALGVSACSCLNPRQAEIALDCSQPEVLVWPTLI